MNMQNPQDPGHGMFRKLQEKPKALGTLIRDFCADFGVNGKVRCPLSGLGLLSYPTIFCPEWVC